MAPRKISLMILCCCCYLVLRPCGSLQQDVVRTERRRLRPVGQGESGLEPQSLVSPGVRDATGSVVKQSIRESRGLEEEEEEEESDDVQLVAQQVAEGSTPAPVTARTPRPGAEAQQQQERQGNVVGQVAALLQRLGERISALHTLAEQQTRRLEGLDYRLTRLEVQGQERGEATRAAMAETARHVQQLAYQGGQLASAVESLRQGQAEQRQLSLATPPVQAQAAGGEVLAKLQGLSNSVQGARIALTALLQDSAAVLARNLTSLANVTRLLREGQAQLLSRHAFSAALAELRYSSTPGCVVSSSSSSLAASNGQST